MTLRLLVADGNARDARDEHRAACGATSSERYARTLAELAPDADCTLLLAADADASVPSGLASFDALLVTGSQLRLAEGGPAVERQVELVRSALGAGLAVFGSCWGMQLAAVVAGGEAGTSPAGPEYGFARRVVPAGPGLGHPLLAGRAAAYDAPALHGDAVIRPPDGAEVLAANGRVAVQALAIRHGAGLFWGTQYHPELDLDELASMILLSTDAIVGAGFCRDEEAVEAYAGDLFALAAGDRPDLAWRHGLDAEALESGRRRREIANFLALVRERRDGRNCSFTPSAA
jgi:GMP synthase (glutamine-hydrolysing)